MLMTLPRILQHTDTTRTFTNKNGILFTVCCQQDEKRPSGEMAMQFHTCICLYSTVRMQRLLTSI